jgi:hypothetical protein
LATLKRNLKKKIRQKQMNRLVVILTLVVLTTHCFGQDKFIINEVVKPFPYVSNENKVNRNNFYEDSLYIVFKTCQGEFGGTILFKNKRTGVEYLSHSTCPVVVNKLNNKYYVTNTLAHLSGFSEILEISNPDSMTIVELPQSGKEREKKIREIRFNEPNLRKGTKSILDSIGVLTIASFPYNGQLYHIVTDFKKTFLTKIEGNNFVTIDTISSKTFWTYNPRVFVSENGTFVVSFKNNEVNGYLEIFENKITVVRSK